MIVSRQFCVFVYVCVHVCVCVCVCVCVVYSFLSSFFRLFVCSYIYTHTHTHRRRDRVRERQTETHRERHTHTQRHTDYYYYYLPMTTGLVVGVKAAVYLILQLFDVAKERCGFWTSNSLLTPRRQCPCAVPETDHQQPDGR